MRVLQVPFHICGIKSDFCVPCNIIIFCLSSLDINECDMSPCAANATCMDLEGSYSCACNVGYRGNAYSSCTNINECDENPNICHTNAECTDSMGSYSCSCNDGYDGNGTYCGGLYENIKCFPFAETSSHSNMIKN